MLLLSIHSFHDNGSTFYKFDTYFFFSPHESSSKSDSMNNTGSYVIMWLDDNPRSYAMPLHCSMHGRVGGGGGNISYLYCSTCYLQHLKHKCVPFGHMDNNFALCMAYMNPITIISMICFLIPSMLIVTILKHTNAAIK